MAWVALSQLGQPRATALRPGHPAQLTVDLCPVVCQATSEPLQGLCRHSTWSLEGSWHRPGPLEELWQTPGAASPFVPSTLDLALGPCYACEGAPLANSQSWVWGGLCLQP